MKRIASQLLKVGETKIWVNSSEKERIKEAMTKEDVRVLIKDAIVRKRTDNLHSRGRARLLKAKKAKGRKRGRGKRTGTKSSRQGKKEKWIKNVRAQRKMLKEMKKSGVVFKKPASKVYLMIKGGYLKGKNYMKAMVEGSGDKIKQEGGKAQ